MFKKYFEKYVETWLDAVFDMVFNHIFTFTSLLALLTFCGHHFWPGLNAQIDSANIAILAAMRKGM